MNYLHAMQACEFMSVHIAIINKYILAFHFSAVHIMCARICCSAKQRFRHIITPFVCAGVCIYERHSTAYCLNSTYHLFIFALAVASSGSATAATVNCLRAYKRPLVFIQRRAHYLRSTCTQYFKF